MRIFLVGFMGSGKSHTGQRLGAKLGTPFADLDEVLEQQTGMTVAQLFAARGEADFRRREATLLREIGQLPRLVLATGGGTPVHSGNMDWMLNHGLTIFLDPPTGVLHERLRQDKGERPLLAGQTDLRKYIERTMQVRRPFYEKAAVHLRPAYATTDVARLIQDQLSAITGH